MFSKIKGVIFDLDGTLVDSMWIWKVIDVEFLNKRNIQVPDDLQKTIEGMSFTETAEYFKNRFALEEEIEEIKIEWSNMARDYYKNKIALKEGVEDFICFLKKNGIKIGIGTSNSKELATAVLEKHDILKHFDTIRTSCEVNKGKPHPDIFLRVAKDLNISPKECLVFEDTYAGVLAGKRAGMKVFAIADEVSFEYKEEIANLADEYIENFKGIA